MITVVITAGFLIIFSTAIPIDNNVEGEPDIECGATSVNVSFKTKNNFEGKIYTRGHVSEPNCVNQEHGKKGASIVLPFQTCGLQRTRSLNPRGVFVTAAIVVSFHVQFLTKVDRAYTIQCFYMEAEKTVSQNLEVSESLSTLFNTQQAPMPVCRYEILENGPTGQPVKFAVLGQQVYHKWTCDTTTSDIFCMVVHSCFVDSGAGDKVQILNEIGCALDKFILQNLEYPTDLMAGREAHVFKFADRPALFFQCQLSITIKEPGQNCQRPQCPEPTGIAAINQGVIGVTGPSPRPPGVAYPGVSTIKSAATTAAPIPQPIPVKLPQPSSPPPVQPKQPYVPPATRTPSEQPGPRQAYAAATLPPFDLGRTLGAFELRFKDFDRKRRAVTEKEVGVWDVQAPKITAFDIDESVPSARSALCNSSLREQPNKAPQLFDRKPVEEMFCFSIASFTVSVSLIVLSFCLSSLFTCLYLLKNRKVLCQG